MKFMQVKYDTALQNVIRKHVFNAEDSETAIKCTTDCMWLLDKPSATVETQLYVALDDCANEDSFFAWDTIAICYWDDENTIVVEDCITYCM